MGWSAVYECGISRSYSLTFFFYLSLVTGSLNLENYMPGVPGGGELKTSFGCVFD